MSDRIVCPVHGMSDCSPLLNGCNRVNELWAEREKCGGSITPHPEARETDTGFSVTSEEYLAQIDAAVARGDAPAYMAEMLRHALAAGGSPTTTPTTEQVEAAAIVLFAQAYGPENSWVGKGVSASERDDFRDCARAALVAAFLVTPEDQYVITVEARARPSTPQADPKEDA